MVGNWCVVSKRYRVKMFSETLVQFAVRFPSIEFGAVAARNYV